MTLSVELLGRLLAAAIRYSLLPAIEVSELPPIEQLSAQALADKVCPEAPDRCTTMAALFDTEHYRIYLRDSLNPDDAMDSGFIVHELVHVLQYKKYGVAYFENCHNRIASERQAYFVQNNYLGEQGVDWREGYLVRFMRCPDEGDDGPGRVGRDE